MHPEASHISGIVCLFLAIALLFVEAGFAQESGSLGAVYEQAGLDQKLGAELPAGLVFVDEQGGSIALDSLVRSGKPVLLTLAYHNCPMLCSVLLDGLTEAVKQMDWQVGREFDIVTISIDPAESFDLARQKKEVYLDKLGRPSAAAGWHFLTGDEASIRAVADAIGFRYAWVEEIGQFVHPPILTFVSGEGRVSRYLQGISFEPRDIRLALVEASDGKVGAPIDLIALYCLQYDSEENAYVVHAANLMRIGGFLTVILLGIMLYVFWRREARLSSASS